MKKIVLAVRQAAETDQKAWDGLASHPLQSWAWGEFRRSMGIDVVRLGVFSDDKLIQGWQLTFHKIPHTNWTIGYFPKGPAIARVMIDELTKLGKEKNAIFMQIEPNEEIKRPRGLETKNENVLNLLISQSPNLLLSHHPLFTKYTFVLDLTKSEEELLRAMHPKTRYNLRVAQKHGVKIQEDNSADAFNAYLSLNEETTSRQGFFAHNSNYHRKMWKTMSDAGIAKLFTATFKNEVLSAWIVFIWKDIIYYPYGTSSRNHREVMAPNLLLWEIAKWARGKGLKYFDLWGALGPDPDPKDPWYGFHRFKAGYNPNLVQFVGSYDLVINPILYSFYKLADQFRWWLLETHR